MKIVFLLGNLKWWSYNNDIFVSFQLPTRLNSQKINETEYIIKSDTLIFIWLLVFQIGIIEVLTPRKWIFLTFYFLTRLLPSKHLKLFSTYLVGLLKMRNKKIKWNKKSNCVTDFLLTVRSSSMKDYTCHYRVSP